MDLITEIGEKTGMRLSANKDFYRWIVRQGPGRSLPRHIERLWRQLTQRNIKDNLWRIYKWINPRARRDDYLDWLISLTTWYADFSGSSGILKLVAP